MNFHLNGFICKKIIRETDSSDLSDSWRSNICANFSDRLDESVSLFSSFLVYYFLSVCPVVVQSLLDNDWTNSAQVLDKYRTNMGRLV